MFGGDEKRLYLCQPDIVKCSFFENVKTTKYNRYEKNVF